MHWEQLGLAIYPQSVVAAGGATYFMVHADGSGHKRLGVLGDVAGFEGARHDPSEALLCPLTTGNLAALRARLPWLNPVPLGQRPSAGFGDRLGLATPGHVQAVRGTGIAPVFAQQSVRENARTGRTPGQVLDDAAWGVFQAGWREAWGADADHLKTPADAEAFVAAGYTFFTIDPGAHVDNGAQTDPVAVLKAKVAALPWKQALDSSPAALRARFLDKTFALDGLTLAFDEETLLRAAAKYGRAIAHTAAMVRHLASLMNGRPFDLEVSVDETETPTSVHEHFYIASELKRLGVVWTSLAPRFVGRFEKGVDYIGDLGEFEVAFARHAAVMRCFGGYKLSLHSGSDKFSVYPIAARHAAGLVHLKTAGTSYLEALRVLAGVEPALFREILACARARYEADRATYHVSAEPTKVPAPEKLSDADLPALLDRFDARQVLHVTFGSVLDRFGVALKSALARHEEGYYAALERHFARHLETFVAGSG